jgi:hypothetical protein
MKCQLHAPAALSVGHCPESTRSESLVWNKWVQCHAGATDFSSRVCRQLDRIHASEILLLLFPRAVSRAENRASRGLWSQPFRIPAGELQAQRVYEAARATGYRMSPVTEEGAAPVGGPWVIDPVQAVLRSLRSSNHPYHWRREGNRWQSKGRFDSSVARPSG